MADKTIIQAIVQAWKIGFPIFFPKLGIVDSVDSEKKLLIVKVAEDFIHNVTWTEPVVPMQGSKCLLIARDNIEKRYTAFGFEKINSIKTKVADKVEIEINENKTFINYNNIIKLTINDEGFLLDLGGKPFKIQGNIEQDGDFKTTGKIEAEKEVTAFAQSSNSVGLSTHLTDYVDTPVGPSVSSKPKAGT
ncbi:hypothetical protein [Leptospira kirschneri]|uniref:hypothetical protein n=1 Tax=Leptospira kirschneri TaxID=29507 RepID=UPI00029739D3|nr:hypothetical protein [Leptospira kirschneri]EKP06172.1 hypothetical protein LEP1GSC018_1909 [Leptospira kirschneri str. 2008720114]EMO82069.1 hypothetical protein LEP1GSC126_3951 [Leptospira kirschneri str. 200801774]EPG50608.1 hypothetical protein LEP1GSC049_3729 [Leptospira kirschneri serovar Cynopteri str. 3522 CT]